MAKKNREQQSPVELSAVLLARLSETIWEEEAAALKESDIHAGMTRGEAIAIALTRKAMRGDLAAAKFICDVASCSEESRTPEQPLEVRVVVVRD